MAVGAKASTAPRSSQTAPELAAAWQASQVSQAGLMLQEFIPAAPGHDWFFHGYSDGPGAGCQPACTGVKDRSYPAYAGLTSFGRCVPNRPLRDAATGLLARIGYRGIADLDLRLDARDGQYKLLDFNPRLGAQFRLFTSDSGLDMVRAAYLDLTGQPVVPAGAPAADAGHRAQLHGRELRPAERAELLAQWRAAAAQLVRGEQGGR